MESFDELIWELENLNFEGLFLGFGVFILILAILLLALVLVVYILQAIALYQLASKNNLKNAWLAWLPIGNMYLLGKLGFEVYAPKDSKNEVLMWVLFGCSIASIFGSPLGDLGRIGVLVLSTWAYYYIFNKINNRSCVLLTILTAIFRIGGIILFFNRKNFTNESEVSAAKVKEEPIKEEQKKEEVEDRPKYCSNCGNKVNKTSKFCSKCGNKL